MQFTLLDDQLIEGLSINKIKYANGVFIAVGTRGQIARSTDGLSWVPCISPFGFSDILALGYGNGRWIAGGAEAKLATSDDDGVTWVLQSNPWGSGTYQVNDVAYHDGRWVTVGNSGRLATSDDGGVTWTVRTVPSTHNIRSVVYGADRWVYVGNSGRNAYSLDGETWVAGQNLPGGPTGYCVAYHDGLFVVGCNGQVFTSNSGTFWTERPLPSAFNSVNGIAHDVDQWVAVSNAGRIASSPDAIVWTEESSPFEGSSIRCITPSPSLWLAGGDQGKAAYSYINAFTVSGAVRDGNNQPAARTVRIYARETGKMLGETVSDPVDGSYAVLLRGNTGEVQRIVLADDVAEGVLYNDIIDRILPGPAA